MKKSFIFFIVLTLAVLTSCTPGGGFKQSDLYGKWENVNKEGDFKVYENSDVIPIYDRDSVFKTYKWGHEWDEQDRTEEQLVKYGNGWYMWKLEGNSLYEVSMTDRIWEGSLTPVTLTISTLTSETLIFERHGRTYTFKKVLP